MRTKVMVEPVTLMTVEYSGGHVYRNGRLERVDNSYGYWADSTFHYHITDYQGNIRAVIAGDGALEEVNNYYPYGGLMGAADTGVQPHKYGAKELDRENGLDLYDSHARWYDPLLARTTTQDPLAEKYRHLSPYAWCAANPIALVDPTGMYFNSADSAKAFEFISLLNKRIDDLSSSDIKDKQEQLDEINQSLHDIELMRTDANTRYSFNLVECEPETVQLPDGTILMNIDIKMDGNFAHEIRHGGQLARGEFGYVNGIPDNRYGASHEVDAYRAQLSACGHLTYMPNIDEADFKSLLLLRLYGQRALWKTVTDIKQINTKLLKSMYEGPGIRLTQLYPIKKYGKEWYKR